MSGRKKVLSEKLKRYNLFLLILLSILIIGMVAVLGMKLFYNDGYYRTVNRKSNIKKSQSLDSKDYETIGWIRVQGTNIDYPLYGVVQDTFEYPVTESYLWSLNMDKDYHNVMITYGHNIMNLGPKPTLKDETFTRMEELMSYVYYDFAKKNKYLQLSMNDKDYLYKIFAVNFMYVADLNEYPEGDFSQEDRDGYVKRLLEESIYDYDLDIQSDDNILSVVTCTRFFDDGKNYDFIVSGRLVRPGEKIDNYKVSRNKNYTEIDEIMKGAMNDEAQIA